MMFWIGVLVGAVLGATLGMLACALCVMARKGEMR